jgi:U2 small nuclear ribonucleoprotein A'
MFPWSKRFLSFSSSRISDDLNETIPNIESLVLTGNNLQELGDIDPLAKLPNLTALSLLTNPIASKKQYRDYVIFKWVHIDTLIGKAQSQIHLSRLPHLRLLDFKKIKQKERVEAAAFFKSKKGKELQKEIQKKARLSAANSNDISSKPKVQANTADIQKIREAIDKATSLQEVERLTKMLQSGQISSEFMNDDQEMMM